jgi:hypothetical protein
MIHASLPGGELIFEGLESTAALLASIGAPRLRQLGFVVDTPFDRAEERLYALLASEFGDGAHSRYNALIRRLVSFQRAAACVS